MRVFGLTGGIASGKSTVGKLFADLGVFVVDADRIAREIVEPGTPALAELVAAFGPAIVDAEGRLDRKRLGALVFADPDKRQRLNAITHPRIAERTQAKLAELAASGHELALYEAALLVENGVHHGLQGLIVVSVDEATQRRRLADRDGFVAEEIEQRLRAQAPLADKLAAATHVIDNRGTLAETRAQVETLHAQLTQKAPTA